MWSTDLGGNPVCECVCALNTGRGVWSVSAVTSLCLDVAFVFRLFTSELLWSGVSDMVTDGGAEWRDSTVSPPAWRRLSEVTSCWTCWFHDAACWWVLLLQQTHTDFSFSVDQLICEKQEPGVFLINNFYTKHLKAEVNPVSTWNCDCADLLGFTVNLGQRTDWCHHSNN